jgi:hypothetical protein
VRFEALTAAVMKSSIFWDIMTRSPLKVNRSFRGTYRLHLQSRSVSRVRILLCFPSDFTLVSCSPKRRGGEDGGGGDGEEEVEEEKEEV